MNKYKIAIFANSRYLDKCKERIIEFSNLGIKNYHFFCLDANILDNLPTDNKELFTFEFTRFRRSLWHERTTKVEYLITEKQTDVLQADADCIWYKDPSHIFNENDDVDMFFSCGIDHPGKIFKQWGFVLRGGFYYIRSNDKNKLFMKNWLSYMQKYNDDQVALNNLLLDNNIVWQFPKDEDMTIMPYHKNLNFNFKFSRKPIFGYFQDYKIMILSAYDFPRLITTNTPYVLDLYNKHEMIGELK